MTRERAVATARFNRPARQTVRSLHILAAAAWFGIDVALVILVVTAMITTDLDLAGLCLRTLPVLLWPLFTAGFLTLLTGLLMGWGTRWEILRYRWVALKLAISLLYLTLIPLGLAPTVADRARLGQELLDRTAVTVDIGDLIYPVTIGPLLLISAIVLSTVKPWGRIRTRLPTK